MHDGGYEKRRAASAARSREQRRQRKRRGKVRKLTIVEKSAKRAGA